MAFCVGASHGRVRRLRAVVARAIATAAIAAMSGAAAAQSTAPGDAGEYPVKAVTIVIGFPPGTATDTIARLIGERLGSRLKRSFVVENRPGQGGSIGAAAAARAAPDGYTLLFSATAPLAINPNLYAKLPYDPLVDFAPVGLSSWLPFLLAVRPESGIQSVGELLARARAKPGELSYASTGNGTTSHLLMTMLAQRSDTRYNHVPYKGSAQAQADLIAGRVDLTFDTMVSLLPHVRAGKLRALAVGGLQRSAFAPEVPTVDEQGVKGFDGGAWLGLVAPAGTPRAIVARLNRELNEILDEPETRKRLLDVGAEILKSTPEEFAAHIRSEHAKWGRLVRESGAKIE